MTISIALFASPGVLAPLQGWWRRFMPALAADRLTHSGKHQPARDLAVRPIAEKPRITGFELQQVAPPASASRPLRIVRVFEVGQSPAQVGRMVISGRMADVCAELDRLAAREAAFH